MKRNNAQNSSAKKKLIPAVAMFTASAVMLSTATYAWFTMNKNAKVTGLNMTATAGGSIEISLGQLGATGLPEGTNGAVVTPTMENESWRNVIAVSDYYSKVGKLKPASSIDANKLFYVDDESVYAGGTAVDDSTKVTQTETTNEAKLTLKATGDTGLVNDDTNGAEGYYVDIPVWIRTTKTKVQEVKCDVTINTPDSAMDGSEDGEELQKAVRVAVIPMSATSDSIGSKTDKNAAATAIAKAAEYTTHGAINVFSTNEETYTNGSAISAAKTAEAAYSTVIKEIEYSRTAAKTTFPEKEEGYNADTYKGSVAIFDLKAAQGDGNYSVQPFVVRVWLEGESTSCRDANAAQDWNIQLNFSGADKAGE